MQTLVSGKWRLQSSHFSLPPHQALHVGKDVPCVCVCVCVTWSFLCGLREDWLEWVWVALGLEITPNPTPSHSTFLILGLDLLVGYEC